MKVPKILFLCVAELINFGTRLNPNCAPIVLNDDRRRIVQLDIVLKDFNNLQTANVRRCFETLTIWTSQNRTN